MSNARAVKYRRMALAETDKAKADLLLKLADECDRGLLCTADWLSSGTYLNKEPRTEAGVQVKWEPPIRGH